MAVGVGIGFLFPQGVERFQRGGLCGDDQHPDRDRIDPDDVSAVHESEIRGVGGCLPQQKSVDALAHPELDHRSHFDVCAGDHLPARLSRLHRRADHDRTGALYRDGDRVERTGARRHGIRRRSGGIQQHFPGAVLQRVCLHLPDRPADLVWSGRRGGGHHDWADS